MKPIRTALLTIVATMAAFGADPALLKMIPGDSAFIAGIRADQIRTSRFGQFLLDQLKSEEANMNKLISATGFDPRRDLTELVVASSDSRGKGKSVVVAKGHFDVNKIAAFAKTEGGGVTSYNGINVMGAHPGSKGMLAVLDSSTAIAGDADAVKGAIDRFKGSAATLDPKTMNKIAELSTRYDAWMVSASLTRLADDFRDPNLGGAMNNNLFSSMESVLGGVRFGANVEVMAEAMMRSEKDASAMVDVIKFLAGMMQMNTQNDKRASQFANLLDKMDLKSSGNQFRMTLAIPEDILEGILKPVSNKI